MEITGLFLGVEETGQPCKMGVYLGNSLWLADDATIIAKSIEELLKALEILKNEARKNDLELNKEKTKILVV